MRNFIKQVARKNKNWSLYKLAQKMNLPGQTVYSWASGRTMPRPEHLDELCRVLDCGMGDLFVPEYKISA